jgi:hypothetical protein
MKELIEAMDLQLKASLRTSHFRVCSGHFTSALISARALPYPGSELGPQLSMPPHVARSHATKGRARQDQIKEVVFDEAARRWGGFFFWTIQCNLPIIHIPAFAC